MFYINSYYNQGWTDGYTKVVDGVDVKYTYHMHSNSTNNEVITFNSIQEAEEYFLNNPCADTASIEGGCFEEFHEAHTHSNSCYNNVKCGTWEIILSASMGDGTSHWRCTGCGSIAYREGNYFGADVTHYKTVLNCNLSTEEYYSANCGLSHGELLNVIIDFK